ncbi:MAG: LCP family protein [Spirochaetia bacterium]|nr:LCP family protein [Spirochaetia bacterium]
MHIGGDELYNQYRRKKLLLKVLVFFIFFLIVSIIGGYFVYLYFSRPNISKYFDNHKPFGILLVLETNKEEQEQLHENLYIGIALVSPGTSRIGLISFFPHTRLRQGDEPLNTRLISEGVDKISSELGAMLKIEIPFYIRIIPDNISKIIDLIEGLNYFLWQPDILENESLPLGEFILEGETAKLLVSAAEQNEYAAALRLFRQYSLLLNLWQNRVEKWDILKNLVIFDIAVNDIETSLNKKELYYIADNFFSQEGWLPLFFEVPLKRNEDSYIVDIEAAALYLKEFRKKITEKSDPFSETLPRMEIKNGTSIKSLARKTRIFFSRKGIQILEFSNADHNDYKHSILLNTSANTYYTGSIAKLTGIKKSYYAVNKSLFTDLILIVGEDFKELNLEN